MAMLGLAPPSRDLARLDDAVALHREAQEQVQQAGADAAEAATHARKETVRARWRARRGARQLRQASMQTGGVRELVNDMLRDAFDAQH